MVGVGGRGEGEESERRLKITAQTATIQHHQKCVN